MPLYIAAIGGAALILPSPTPMRARLRDGAVVAPALFVAYIPWLASLASQMRRVEQDFWIPPPGILDLCQELTRICGIEHIWTWDQYVHWLLPNTSSEVPYLTATILAIGLLIGALGPRRRLVIALAVAALAPPLLAAILSLRQRSIFLPAAFLPSSVIMAVLLAGTRRWITVVIVLLTAINLMAYEHERDKENWRRAAEIVSQMPPVPHRLIVFVANEGQLPFDYYYRPRPGEVETGTPAGFFEINPPRTQRRVLADGDLDDLRKLIATGQFDDVVLIAAHTGYSDPLWRTETYLEGNLHLTERQDLPIEITIFKFQPL
jgi:hypothetical protein